MNSEIFEKLVSEDWKERASAVDEIERHIADESNIDALLSIRDRYDREYTEDKDARWEKINETLYTM